VTSRPVVVDSNVANVLAEDASAYETVRAEIDAGRLEMLITHANVDELTNTPDPEKRARLLAPFLALGRHVPTGAAVFGISKFGGARFTGDIEQFETLRSGNAKNTYDALIGATASCEGCVLVTNDTRLFNRATEIGLTVIRPLPWIEQLRDGTFYL
jgi:rRNA-processing protein FCF1